MSIWPLYDTTRWSALGTLSASSNGTAMTSGSTNTKGSWVQLSSALPFAVHGMVVATQPPTAADCLVDIGLGAAASEVVVVSNLTTSSGASAFGRSFYRLPLSLPAGERLAARCQSTTNTATVRIAALVTQQGLAPVQPLSRIITYGADTTDSGGTSIDPGASTNTKGSWVQLTASTTNPVSALIVAFGNRTNTVRTDAMWLFDIGIGAGGSEVVVLPNLWTITDSVNDSMAPFTIGPLPIQIPIGTRIAVRAQCSINDATDRLLDVFIYGCD